MSLGWFDAIIRGRSAVNQQRINTCQSHAYICMCVMWCIVSLMQSKVHTNCLLGLVKKCRVSVWYFLVYTVSADVVVAVVVVVEYNCLFTLRTNLLLTFCCSLLKFRLKIHLILSSFFFCFSWFFLILCFCFSSSSYCV